MAKKLREALNLDALFRPGSKAQQAAAVLLDGKPVSRPELAKQVGVSPTTIPRTVGILERAGVRIETTLAGDGRTAVYQVVGLPGPLPTDAPTYSPDRTPAVVRILSVGVRQGEVVVGIELGSVTYSARLLSESASLPTERGDIDIRGVAVTREGLVLRLAGGVDVVVLQGQEV